MAVTSLWAIKSNLNTTINYAADKNKTLKDLEEAINYAKNDDKTENSYYVSAINCNVDSVKSEMLEVKKCFNKTDGILGFHGYQSFKENEVTPEQAHEIGIKLANEMWGDKFQVLVTTHLNTNHLHNHFIVNSVSFVDGSKFYSSRATTAQLRYLNDSICREYGISYLEEKVTPNKKMDFRFYLKSDYENKSNYYQRTKKDIDYVIKKSKSYNEFIDNLKSMNYEVYERYGKLSVRNLNYKRNIRIERYFGDEYSISNIKSRIIEEELDNKIIEEEYINYDIKKYKSKTKSHGIVGLYKYYCYLLKIYPNKPNYKITYDMQCEINKLELYDNLINFFNDNNIKSYDDLKNIKNTLYESYDHLNQMKRKLRYQYSRINNQNEKERILSKIKSINEELNGVNKKIKLCEYAESCTPNIENKINEIEKENNKEKIKE